MNKILFINGGGVGGAETVTILYADILNKAGFDIEILTQITKHDLCNCSVKLIPQDIKHKEAHCRFIIFFFYVLKTIWEYKPKIIFCWNFNVVKYILKPIINLRLTQQFKLVCRCPNTPSIMDPIERNGLNAFKISDIIIAQTKEMAIELNTIINIPERKIVTIYNPIFKNRIIKNISNKFHLNHQFINYIAVGRMSEQKDYITLLSAFAIVLKTQPNSRLYILGKNNDTIKNSLNIIITKNNMSNMIFFEGYQSNPHKYEIEADAYVLSSVYEGLPNAMIEAMYLGVPVAATTCIPYISQIIKDGINGYTCPIKNPERLAQAMINAAKIKGLPKYQDINCSEKDIIDLFNNL